MPPVNDNWANAIAISGASGQTVGNNIGATADVGILTGYGKSVWYRFIRPNNLIESDFDHLVNLPFAFSTRVHAGDATPTDFNTVLSIFRSNPAGTEPQPGPWITNDQYAGWSDESRVVATMMPGGVYYIRVDGFNGDEGRFTLRWRRAYNRYLSTRCYTRYTEGWVCVGGAAVPNVSGPSTTQFVSGWGSQTFPRGNYAVRFCSGGWRYADEQFPEHDWVTTRVGRSSDGGAPLFGGEHFVQIAHPAGVAYFNSVAQRPFLNQRAAEEWAKCQTAEFFHEGGGVTLQFVDRRYVDSNLPGTSLPAFTLYRITPIFEVPTDVPPIFSAQTIQTTGDTNANFKVRLVTPRNLANIQCELLSSGGITSVSAPVTLGFQGGAVRLVGPFTYSVSPAGETRLTAQLRLSVQDGVDVQVLTFNLTPVLETISFVSRQSSGPPQVIVLLRVFNTGYGPTRACTVRVLSSSSNVASPNFDFGLDNINLGVINPGAPSPPGPATSKDFRLYYSGGDGNSGTVTLEMTDGPYVHPPVVATIPVT